MLSDLSRGTLWLGHRREARVVVDLYWAAWADHTGHLHFALAEARQKRRGVT